jgi:hypothetical protein
MVFFSFIFLFFCWILFAPIHIIIDTTQKIYGAGLLGLISAKIVRKQNEGIRILIKILFFKIYINPFKFVDIEKQAKVTNRLIRKRSLKTKEIRFEIFVFKTIWNIARKTKFKIFHLNIDTGDVIKNASLIPVFVMINTGKWNFSVNYENKFKLIIHLEHRLSIILWLIFTNFIKYKFKQR